MGGRGVLYMHAHKDYRHWLYHTLLKVLMENVKGSVLRFDQEKCQDTYMNPVVTQGWKSGEKIQ